MCGEKTFSCETKARQLILQTTDIAGKYNDDLFIYIAMHATNEEDAIGHADIMSRSVGSNGYLSVASRWK